MLKVQLRAHMGMDIYSHNALSLSFHCGQEGHTNNVSISPLGRSWQNFIKCESSAGKQSTGPCTWRDVMIEKAMWIASGSHGGLVVMLMERYAPKG